MILGQFSPSIFFQVSSISTGITIILIYFISQHLKHDPPFPNSWISDVANHYPQYIFFRTATISGSCLMGLGWFTNYFYIKTIAMEHVVNVNKYKPQVILILGLMGSFLLMGSTANLDTGKQNGKWHTFCASRFFIFTVVAQLLNTALFTKLHFSYKIFNRTLVYLKLVQALLILIQIWISAEYGLFEIYGQNIPQDNFQSVIGKILEWTLTYTVLFGFVILSYDVKNFKYVYQHITTEQTNQQQLTQE